MTRQEELQLIIEGVFDLDLKEKSKEGNNVNARFIFCKICVENIKISKSSVARFLGLTHGCVHNALNKIDSYMLSDKHLKDTYNFVLKEFKKIDPYLLEINKRIISKRIKAYKGKIKELEESLI